jgi:spondin-1
VFRVDSKHHLVSLVSMIYPSPDWFVGVSGLELCMSNGSWLEEKVMNLYPYDAGTDSGPTYISSDQPTLPKEAIRRIKPNQPNDPRSPFHDPDNKDMKPLARLYLTRQRLYEKNCENQEENVDENFDQNQDNDQKKNCRTTDWSDPSECDCDTQTKTFERTYKRPNHHGCKVKLTKTVPCDQEDLKNCPETDQETDGGTDEGTEDGESQTSDPECVLHPWSTNGKCSTLCGKGVKTFTRDYVNQSKRSKCMKKKNRQKLTKEEECEGNDCSGDIEEPKPGTKVSNYF